jgi:hypothetical protein
MDIFTVGLGLLIVACFALYYYTRSSGGKEVKDANFNRFQQLYLVVYLLAMSNLSYSLFLNKKVKLYVLLISAVFSFSKESEK